MNSKGEKIPYDSGKLIENLKTLSQDLDHSNFNFEEVEQRVREGVSNNMTTEQFCKYLSETLAYLNIEHPDYSYLAARIVVQRLHKKTFDSLKEYA